MIIRRTRYRNRSAEHRAARALELQRRARKLEELKARTARAHGWVS